VELDDGTQGDGDGQSEDQVFQLGKEAREKQKSNGDQGKGIDSDFCFANQDTREGAIGFRIDSCTSESPMFGVGN
jgi:hypothetical protein